MKGKKVFLRDFRVSNGISQEEMAIKLGISLSFYEKIERGERNPSYKFLLKFKNAFPHSEIEAIFFNH